MRLQRREQTRLVADGHLGKLTSDLRLLGVDTLYSPQAQGAELVALSASEDRALLTRDRRLLMRSAIQAGYYPRSQLPTEQTREVLKRFGLRPAIAPFTRCLRCNGLLASVAKEEVVEPLEPLTKMYYEKFRRCRDCGRIYWGGSHFGKLQRRLEQLLSGLV